MCVTHYNTISHSSYRYQSAQPTQKPATGTTDWSQDTIFCCRGWRSAVFCLITALLTLWMFACWRCHLFQSSGSSWRPKKGSLRRIKLGSRVSWELLFVTLLWLVCCGGKTGEWFDFWNQLFRICLRRRRASATLVRLRSEVSFFSDLCLIYKV